MSNILSADADTGFEFWEFVCCTKCRMPFALENGSATVPFWLTECGHVICNNHLNRDQSCCQCGAQDIELAPLQREMEAPMSQWFRSIPLAIDSIASSVKFQQEAMANQVRYYKSRHQQLRQLVERLKRDVLELKKSNDVLQGENAQYRLQMGHTNSGATMSFLNSNGKRPMTSMHQFEDTTRRPRTDSSPRSIATPVGPDRLTLLPSQQLPELSSEKQQEQNGHPHFSSHAPECVDSHVMFQGRPMSSQRHPLQRPASSRSLEHYAYTTQDSRRFHAPQLTHVQAIPKVFQRTDLRQNSIIQEKMLPTPSKPPPPPTSSRFRPATNILTPFSTNAMSGLPVRQQKPMGPPPTPQRIRTERCTPFSSSSNTQAPVFNGLSINRASSSASDHRRVASSTSTTPSQQYLAGAAARRFFPEPSNETPLASACLSDNTPGQHGVGIGQRGRFG